jgi:hypothetical protein
MDENTDNEAPQRPERAQSEPVEVAGVIWDNDAPSGFPVGSMDARRRSRNTD